MFGFVAEVVLGSLADLIGAVGVIICGGFSLWAVIAGHRNSKALASLKNSESVKDKLANKRLEKYEEIMEYINDWYELEHVYGLTVWDCTVNYKHGLFKHRLTDISKIIEERDRVALINRGYIYIDQKTYYNFKVLERLLEDAVRVYHELKLKGKDFKLFSYFLYCDIYTLLNRAAKSVNKYIRGNDSLKFKVYTDISMDKINKTLDGLNVINIYVNHENKNAFNKEFFKEIEGDLADANKQILEWESALVVVTDEKQRQLYVSNIKRKKAFIKKLKSFKPVKYKVRKNKEFKNWERCKKCENKKCIFAQDE